MRKLNGGHASPYRQSSRPNAQQLSSNRSQRSDRSRSQSASKNRTSSNKYNNISNLYSKKQPAIRNKGVGSTNTNKQKTFYE